MAIGTEANFVIYQPEFFAGFAESVNQFTDAFNAGSRNAVRLVPRILKGDFEKESFFQYAAMLAWRDILDVSATADAPMNMDEFISVKVARRIGPIAQTYDSWKKLGSSLEEMSLLIGRGAGEQAVQDYLNTALMAATAALTNVGAAITVDKTAASPDTLTHSWLVSALAKMGDRAGRIVAWFGHSKTYFDLVQQAISDQIFNVADTVIYGGTPGTLGRPFIVTDSPALIDSTLSGDVYSVLGLVENGVVVTESEERTVIAQPITGLKNLVYRIQGEYAFNIGIKGFKWDVTTTNPDNAALGTGANWIQAATNIKDLAGVVLEVN